MPESSYIIDFGYYCSLNSVEDYRWNKNNDKIKITLRRQRITQNKMAQADNQKSNKKNLSWLSKEVSGDVINQ